jgi:hypothetical protein
MPAVPKVSCYSKGRSACVVQSLEIHSSVPAPLGSRPGLAPTYVLTHMSWCRISPVMVGKKALVVDLRGVDGDAGRGPVAGRRESSPTASKRSTLAGETHPSTPFGDLRQAQDASSRVGMLPLTDSLRGTSGQAGCFLRVIWSLCYAGGDGGVSRRGARPWRRALRAAWARLQRSSSARMLLTWVRTVASLMVKRWAISMLLCPWATRQRTSTSRSVWGPFPGPGGEGSASALSSLRAMERSASYYRSRLPTSRPGF